MPQTSVTKSTDTDRQQSVTHGEGARMNEPIQRSLRGVIREQYEEEGDLIVSALFEDLDSTHIGDEGIADKTGVEKAQLSRIRQGKAHPPGRLIVWAIDNTRHQPARVVVAVCAAAEGEFKPKPPPSVEDRHAATLDVLHEMGIGEVVTAKVQRKLGMVKP
jgi:hypothetical protein